MFNIKLECCVFFQAGQVRGDRVLNSIFTNAKIVLNSRYDFGLDDY